MSDDKLPKFIRRIGFDAADVRSLGIMAGGAAVIIPLATWLLGGIDTRGFGTLRIIPDPAPLIGAAPMVLTHLILAITAMTGGVFILSMRKGTAQHKQAGRLWAVIMILVAVSGLAIEPTRFTPAHAAALLVFWMVPYAIVKVRRGDLRGHKQTVAQLIIAMIIVGGLTMLPGHLLHPVFFAATPLSVAA
jgi:uncharacterized membrane protein